MEGRRAPRVAVLRSLEGISAAEEAICESRGSDRKNGKDGEGCELGRGWKLTIASKSLGGWCCGVALQRYIEPLGSARVLAATMEPLLDPGTVGGASLSLVNRRPWLLGSWLSRGVGRQACHSTGEAPD